MSKVLIQTSFFLLLISFQLNAQVVNIESQRISTDTTGWAGKFGGNFNWTKNVDQVFSIGGAAHVQYKTFKNLYLLLGDYSFLKGNDKKLIDNAFLHFRINHKFTNIVRGEFLTQVQNNKISKIDTRFLIGAGPRFKIPSPRNLSMYLGIIFLYEYEKELTDPPGYNHFFRNSSYLTFTYSLNDRLKLISTTFYQPRIDYFRDFRVLNQETLVISITKRLAVTLNWNYLFDQYPVEGVPNSTSSFVTGFTFELK